MKAADVPPGYLFRYPEHRGDAALYHQEVFLRLNNFGIADRISEEQINVVNVANMCAAHVDPDAEVVLIEHVMENSIKDMLAKDTV